MYRLMVAVLPHVSVDGGSMEQDITFSGSIAFLVSHGLGVPPVSVTRSTVIYISDFVHQPSASTGFVRGSIPCERSSFLEKRATSCTIG